MMKRSPVPHRRVPSAAGRALAATGCALLLLLPLACSDDAPGSAGGKGETAQSGKPGSKEGQKPGKRALKAAKEANPGRAPKPMAPRKHELADVLELATTESSLGKVRDGFVSATTAISPDGRRLAYAAVSGDTVVVIDGEASDPFETMGPTGIVFSPDGKRVAYSTKTEEGNFVVLDGKRLGPYWGLGSSGIDFSPNGARVAFVAARDGKYFVVLDGEEQTAYQGIGAQGIEFSADGRRYAYDVLHEGRRGVVVDGELGPLHDGIGSEGFVLSEDGSTCAYAALDGKEWSVVVNGEKGASFSMVSDLRVGPNGERVAYRAFPSDTEVTVVVDGERSAGYEALGPSSPVLGPDGRRVAYSAVRDGKQFVVVDGKEGPSFEPGRQIAPVFSDDAKHVAYIGRGADTAHVVYLDHELVAEYPFIIKKTLRFAPGSDKLFFIAKRDEKFFSVLGGEESKGYANVGRGTDLCSPDGARAAFLVHRQDKEEFVVVDGAEGDSYEGIAPASLAFTPDSGHVTFVAAGEGKQFVVIDGVGKTRGYDAVLSPQLAFAGSDKAHFVALRDGEFFLVELSLAQG